MDKYLVTIRPEAIQMLDSIYSSICFRSIDNSTAEKIVSSIEQAILSLELMPQRGSVVTTGNFANRGYRKLIVKNYIIIYTILKIPKEVVVIFIKNIKPDL